jgi:hypothetical protein
MSQSVRDFEKSIVADNAIVQYTVVKVTATGCDTATANGDAIIGVAQNAPNAGEMCTVRILGTSKAVASAAITVGTTVTATTGGKIVTDSTDTHGILGRALEAAANTGDIIEVLLQPSVI